MTAGPHRPHALRVARAGAAPAACSGDRASAAGPAQDGHAAGRAFGVMVRAFRRKARAGGGPGARPSPPRGESDYFPRRSSASGASSTESTRAIRDAIGRSAARASRRGQAGRRAVQWARFTRTIGAGAPREP